MSMPDPSFYFEHLYPMQDQILRSIRMLETGFYLTGGTAASRGYLNHRFSDDLDLFVNDDKRFGLWTERLIHDLARHEAWDLKVLSKEERFARLEVAAGNVVMKIELVNDVPAHVGEVIEHNTLGRLDTAENILANKITAVIDRDEPKDLADIWGFCCRRGLHLSAAIESAQSKAAGVFPADLARVLCSATRTDWELVRWIQAPPLEQFLEDLVRLGESLIL
jgi:hypothetical protein